MSSDGRTINTGERLFATLELGRVAVSENLRAAIDPTAVEREIAVEWDANGNLPIFGNTTHSFDITGGRVRAIYAVRNPDKLRGFLERMPGDGE